MKTNAHILIISTLFTIVFATPVIAEDSQQNREWQIKAAFLYNFINFVDWPEGKMPDNDEPILIGIIGNKEFTNAFNPMISKQAKGKNIAIKHFEHLNTAALSDSLTDAEQEQGIEELKKCHVLLISHCHPSPTCDTAALIEALKEAPVLIISGGPGFLETGGHIRFLKENKKLRFEINLDAAKRSGLKIRSKLLKLATRVINKDSEVAGK